MPSLLNRKRAVGLRLPTGLVAEARVKLIGRSLGRDASSPGSLKGASQLDTGYTPHRP